MPTSVTFLRCPACGLARRPAHFGIVDETFDPAQLQHELGLRVDHYHGGGRIVVQRHPLPLQLARAQRDALQEALRRLEAEIAAAEEA